MSWAVFCRRGIVMLTLTSSDHVASQKSVACRLTEQVPMNEYTKYN